MVSLEEDARELRMPKGGRELLLQGEAACALLAQVQDRLRVMLLLLRALAHFCQRVPKFAHRHILAIAKMQKMHIASRQAQDKTP